MTEATKCNRTTEVYSRIVGYFRPVVNFNIGKRREFKDRKTYSLQKAMCTDLTKK